MDLTICAKKQQQSFNAQELQDAGLIPHNGLYYPTIYYPPIPMQGASNEDQILAGMNYDETRHSSVYIHLPFCRSRCLYCHWMVNVDSSEKEIDDYLSSLAMEMTLWKEKFGVKKISPHSILIGGGTPTALSTKTYLKIIQLFECLHRFRKMCSDHL